VKRGAIVVYPNYQRSLFTYPAKFTRHAARGIRDGVKHVQENLPIELNLEEVSIVGHSFGGTISSNLLITYKEHGIPKPTVGLVCQPGYGPFKGARLKEYIGVHDDLMVTFVSGAQDKVVGSDFAFEIFSQFELEAGVQKSYLVHHPDKHGSPSIGAKHAEPCSPNFDFDSGSRNFINTASLQDGVANAVDYYCYWKILDAMMDCRFRNFNCDIAFTDSAKMTFMGEWSDGKEVKRLTVGELGK